jgi:predicted LPLAT superfamily acyltransferase
MPDLSGSAGTYRIFRSFAEAIVDRLAYLEGGPKTFRYAYEGVEHLTEAFAGAEGAIVLSAHLGNIEVSGGPPGNRERMKKLSVVRFDAQGDHGRALVERMPEAWRPNLIAVNRAEGFSALTVARALREGGVVAMMGDRLVDDRSVTVELFGSPARFPAGPWLLAAIARVPVIVAGCFKEGPDTYRLVALPPRRVQFDRARPRDEQIAEWAQAFARDVEAFGRRWPEQWYNFHDVWATARREDGP